MKFNLSLLASLLSGALLMSCSSQDDGPVYSCDETVNTWVKKNMPSILSMSFADWQKLDELKKPATFAAFTDQQRHSFWKARVAELENQDFWSEEEQEHLRTLYNIIESHPEWFAEETANNEEVQDDIYATLYEWKNIGQEQFGWSDKLAFAMLASGNTLLNKKGEIALVTEAASPVRLRQSSESSEKPSCNCNTGSDYCDTNLSPTGMTCKSTSCDGTAVFGCGFLLRHPCNGRCG